MSAQRWGSFDTWSNAIFPLAGAVGAVGHGAPGALFALSMIYLGISSAGFHSKAVPWGNTADVLAMYFVVIGLAIVSSGLALFDGVVAAVAMGLVGGVGAFLLRFKLPGVRMQAKIGALAGGMILLVAVRAAVAGPESVPDFPLLVVSVGFFGLALFCRALVDKYGGHDTRKGSVAAGFWHILAGLGFLVWFLAVV